MRLDIGAFFAVLARPPEAVEDAHFVTFVTDFQVVTDLPADFDLKRVKTGQKVTHFGAAVTYVKNADLSQKMGQKGPKTGLLRHFVTLLHFFLL